jgi:hypothetical protein
MTVSDFFRSIHPWSIPEDKSVRHNPDDFTYDNPARIACPYPDESDYHEVDCVPHKTQGWMLCEVYDTCPAAINCDWSGRER